MARSLKAQVRGGRLVLDEPTELPEGSEVDLVLADTDLFFSWVIPGRLAGARAPMTERDLRVLSAMGISLLVRAAPQYAPSPLPLPPQGLSSNRYRFEYASTRIRFPFIRISSGPVSIFTRCTTFPSARRTRNTKSGSSVNPYPVTR